MRKEFPARKHPRLKGYDYSSNGAYFITFCVKNRREILGEIVGRGILDAPIAVELSALITVELSEYGINLCNTINFVNQNFNNIMIDKYVVMPNHVHMIVLISKNGGDHDDIDNDIVTMDHDGGASGKPRPTKPHPTNALIPKLLSSIKRYTNKLACFNMWQDNYHDHIIRSEAEYQRIWAYIDKNPAKWTEDRYFI